MIEKQKLHRNGIGNKIFLGYSILIFCFAMLVGIESIAAKEPLPVKIGAVYNLSGSQAELDILSSRGALLAVDQMNRKKGVLVRPLRLVMADGESKPTVVKQKTVELLEKNPYVSALMGLSDTDMVLASAPVAAFRKAYVRAYPGSKPNAFAALGYDAARLLMAAVAEADSSDPDDVRLALSRIRQFQGVTGTISYPPGSRIPSKSVTILQIEQGQRKLVRNLLPARVPSP